MEIARLWYRDRHTFLVQCATFLTAAIAFLPTRGFSQASNLDSQLIQAVYHRDLAAVKQLIADGANPNASDVPGMDCFGGDGFEPPPLHIAARYAVTYPILVYLVEHGANLELRSKATDCMAGAPKEER